MELRLPRPSFPADLGIPDRASTRLATAGAADHPPQSGGRDNRDLRSDSRRFRESLRVVGRVQCGGRLTLAVRFAVLQAWQANRATHDAREIVMYHLERKETGIRGRSNFLLGHVVIKAGGWHLDLDW